MIEIPGLMYKSPYSFTPRQRLMLKLAPTLIATLMKALLATCTKELRHKERIDATLAAHGHAILAIWHETSCMAAVLFRNSGYHTLASYSFDGEMAVRVLRRLGILAVRGSSSNGGTDAIRNLAEALRHVPCVGFTLDGPRGPRREAKAGIAVLSARTGLPVIPLAFTATPAWRLKSWDRMPIPKPFSRIVMDCGEPISPPPGDSPEEVEQMRLRVQTSLNALHASIES